MTWLEVLTLQVLGVFLVYEGGQITSIVENQVKRLSTGESCEGLFDTPGILFLGFSLPCENRDTSSCDAAIK